MLSDACCLSDTDVKKHFDDVSVFVDLCNFLLFQQACITLCVKLCVLCWSQIHSQHEIVNMHVVKQVGCASDQACSPVCV